MEWIVILLLGGILLYTFKKKAQSTDQIAQEGDLGLAEFRITITTTTSSFQEQPKSKNKDPGKWIVPGEVVKIGGLEITGGYIYAGGQLTGLDDYQTEASLIDPTLKLDMNAPDYLGADMGYWPRYESISPRSRAALIEWLASDRNDPETYIGYVFLLRSGPASPL